jgi:hypothetical protein
MLTSSDRRDTLSMTIFGASSRFSAKDNQEFVDTLRSAAAHKRLGPKVAGGRRRRGASTNRPPTWLTSIRVNRVSGPNGVANGKYLEGIRCLVTDRLVTGAVPRNKHATVIVPIRQRGTNLVIACRVFYAAVTSRKVSASPFDAIPAPGWVSRGSRVIKAAKAGSVSEQILCDGQAWKRFAAEMFIEFDSSEKEGREYLSRHLFDCKMLLEATHRIDGAIADICEDIFPLVGHTAFCRGEQVLVRSLPAHEGTLSVEDKVGKIFSVHRREIGVDPGRSLNLYNDDDTAVAPELGTRKVMISEYRKGRPLNLVTAAKGDHTVGFGCCGSHTDAFCGRDSLISVIEDKRAVLFGHKDASIHLPGHGIPAMAAPGTLVYPRYKVGTVLQTDDLEFHCLASVMHATVAQPPSEPPEDMDVKELVYKEDGRNRKKARKMVRESWKEHGSSFRGCWSGGNYYPRGAVVMDWPSRYSGNSVSAASVRVQLGNRDYNARRRVVMAQLQVRNDENVGLNWRMAVSRRDFIRARNHCSTNNRSWFAGDSYEAHVQSWG